MVVDPGVHIADTGEDRVTVVSQPAPDPWSEDQCLRFVQDDETISNLHQCVLPPDEHYEALAEVWAVWWPEGQPRAAGAHDVIVHSL